LQTCLFAANIGPRSGGGGGKSKSYGSGRQTLRFKANGSAKVEEVDDARTIAEEKINELLEGFLGINDAELGECGKIHAKMTLANDIDIGK
jgi:hypothetical protein